ncbi:glycoside hydrolase family 15 protein [Paenirhodobacter populi]|uniref:Glycoside hydrolase family 15 protein n=1 Tax=Paenirhodobacter populi TaxID=2306993 RepID=A0A443KGR9_9RHOB|nr:glycoside hydrolase family 15 protein [Sinirhodobacter populi]RWR04873.1 glycoside hydrolase family 15 protein [Sinirhodobacter populi]RWR31950.1 glycoside hydrolase family 15 protein [Sinirhodobacter populi]
MTADGPVVPAKLTEKPTVKQSLDLGVIGNSAIAALIDETGGLNWMCIPRMDGDPVFCGLLDPGEDETGVWRFSIANQTEATQRYQRNTAVLETVLTDAEGNRAKIIDFAPRFRMNGRVFRGATIVRIVEPVAGAPRLKVALRPRCDYGASRPERTRGTNHVRYILGDQVLRLTTDAPVEYVLDETPFLLDRPIAFVLGPDESLSAAPMSIARHFLRETRGYWLDWVRGLALPADFQSVVIRAAITLKLCSNEETGAIVAALTTSIPEYGASGRTWDYRLCWLRDSYFTVQALNSLNATRTMENYLAYVSNLVAGARDGYLQPLFGLGLERVLDEHIVPSLSGYRGLGPVRRGNAAWTQVQNDGYGSVILAAIQCFFDERLPDMGGEPLFHRLERLGEEAEARWDQPDAGLWEFRTRNEVHTHSALMCWAGCDRLARIAHRLALPEAEARWTASAERIRSGILDHCWNAEMRSFVSAFDGNELDASLLLMARIGFIAPDDPRFLATVAACEKELRFGNHLYRYRRPDDFGAPETAFTACTFWLIDALTRTGRREEARQIFDDILSRRNHLGLLSEGVHVESGELWGNFPQSYSMVGLINAAMTLSRNWEEVL